MRNYSSARLKALWRIYRLKVKEASSKSVERTRAERRSRALLRRFTLPSPLTLEDLYEFVEEMTNLPLVIKREDRLAGEGLAGFWHQIFDGDEVIANEILYTGSEESMRGQFIILHEVAHILFGHKPEPMKREALAQGYPDLNPEKIYMGRCRDDVRTGPEAEAEILAGLLQAEIVADSKQDDEILRFGEVVG